MKELCSADVSISACNFARKDKMEKLLNGIFKEVTVTEEILKDEVAGLSELLHKIKYTGIRGEGINGKGFWTPRTIDKFERIYRKKFERIIVTYQVFFCQAVK